MLHFSWCGCTVQMECNGVVRRWQPEMRSAPAAAHLGDHHHQEPKIKTATWIYVASAPMWPDPNRCLGGSSCFQPSVLWNLASRLNSYHICFVFRKSQSHISDLERIFWQILYRLLSLGKCMGRVINYVIFLQYPLQFVINSPHYYSK